MKGSWRVLKLLQSYKEKLSWQSKNITVIHNRTISIIVNHTFICPGSCKINYFLAHPRSQNVGAYLKPYILFCLVYRVPAKVFINFLATPNIFLKVQLDNVLLNHAATANGLYTLWIVFGLSKSKTNMLSRGFKGNFVLTLQEENLFTSNLQKLAL